jgi:hypothetical protein
VEPAWIVIGAVLLMLGAVGATVSQRGLERRGRGRMTPLTLVPFGILMGAGAAMIRGWDLWISIAVGAVVVPLVGVVGRLIEVRQQRRRQGDRPPS